MDTYISTYTSFERTAQLIQSANCYINIHSSNIEKKRLLNTMSQRMNFNLKVEIIERK